MKIRNAIPPLALSALLINNVFAQEVKSKTTILENQSFAKLEKKVSGKINSPTKANSKNNYATPSYGCGDTQLHC